MDRASVLLDSVNLDMRARVVSRPPSFPTSLLRSGGTSVPTYCHLRLKIVLLERPITFSELFTIFIRVQSDK